MNKQLLDAYDQINLTISDLEIYAIDNYKGWHAYSLADSLKSEIELLMKLEGMKIPGE